MFLPCLFVFGAMATALTFFSAFFKPAAASVFVLSCRDLADPPLPLWFLPSLRGDSHRLSLWLIVVDLH